MEQVFFGSKDGFRHVYLFVVYLRSHKLQRAPIVWGAFKTPAHAQAPLVPRLSVFSWKKSALNTGVWIFVCPSNQDSTQAGNQDCHVQTLSTPFLFSVLSNCPDLSKMVVFISNLHDCWTVSAHLTEIRINHQLWTLRTPHGNSSWHNDNVATFWAPVITRSDGV